MSIEYRFILPLDVLLLRGNQLFGDPGSYGESLVPPWPSVAAGAIRSRMLTDDKIDLVAYSRNEIVHPTLGTPENPGSFVLAGFYLARKKQELTEILTAPPADLVIQKREDASGVVQSMPPVQIRRLMPRSVGLPSSCRLPLLPVLSQDERSKSESGWWLTQAGWEAYLKGNVPKAEQLVHSSELWKFDDRVGIGMEISTRSAESGKLFTSRAVALNKDVGFLAGVMGALPPRTGLLRIGGDGRAASIEAVDVNLPEPDYDAISQARRCRVVLTSPGIFPGGWRLPGVDADLRVSLEGVRARFVSACVSRFETISGWDLAKGMPKPAQRVVPAGSVYWFDELDATPDALRKLVENGLWDESSEDGDQSADRSRRAEGFNRVAVAPW